MMWDYDAFPLWCAAPGRRGGVSRSSVPVSAELRIDLQKWSDELTALRWGPRGPDDPEWCGPPAAELVRLNDEGRALANRVRRELGDGWAVIYHDEVTHEEVTVGPS